MYICHISIDNFKSFNGKTDIPFEKGFTTISGPNGSGKSNIIDSILFCLALSTSRTMRAEKLTDLINNLSNRKTCMVEITFQKESFELTDDEQTQLAAYNALPDDSNDKADMLPPDKMTVSRRIKVANSGSSSVYTLNSQTSTLGEIHEMLSRYHVSPGSFNVMMQGDVQGFVNMSPMERRKIIDEIAGVADFDRKIDQAQRELEKTGENIDRNTLLLGEINERIAQLADERKTALKYRKLKAQKQGWEAKQYVAKYLDAKQALALARDNIAATEAKKQEATKTLKALFTQAETTRKALTDINDKVKKKGEDQHIALKTQIEGLKGHISRRQDKITFQENQILENREQIQNVDSTVANQKDSIAGINEELATLNQQIKELQPLFDAQKREYDKLTKQMEAMGAESGELGTERVRLRDAIKAAEDNLATLQREHMSLEGQQHQLQTTLQLRQENATGDDEKRIKLTHQQTDLQAAISKLNEQKTSIEQDMQAKAADLAGQQTQLQDAIALFNRLNGEMLQLEAKKRAYEDMNYARPVEIITKAGLDGVFGPLGQLLMVDGDYATAMEVALGGRIQHVVVADDTVASKAIQLLKDQRAGRATFLPLNKLQPARRLPPLPRAGGIVDYALQLVAFDPQYVDAFSYALGDTLIMDDIEAARPLLRRHRMVTLDGALLEKSGAMTGGSSSSKSGQSRLASAANLETALQDAEEKMKQANYKRNTLTQSVDKLALTLDALKQERSDTIETLSANRASLSAVEEQLAELNPTNDAGNSPTATLTEELAALGTTLAAAAASVATAQSGLADLLANRDALDAKLPADAMSKLQQQMADIKFEMDYYDTQIRNVQRDVQGKTLEKDYQEAGIKEYITRVGELKVQNDAFAKEITAAREEIAITEKQIGDLEAQTLELDDELKQLQDERDVIQAKLIEEEKEKSTLERDCNQYGEQLVAFEERVLSLKPQVSEAYQTLLAAHNAWLKQQETAAENAAEEATVEDADADTEQTDSDDDSTDAADTATSTADNDLAVPHPDKLDDVELPNAEEVSQKIVRLEKRMAAMEPVNMRAIDDYAVVDGRRKELSDKIDTLNTERESINVRISGYEELKRGAFQKSFDEIDGHFRSIFETLAAGDGHLVLSNPDDPLNSGMTLMARPRGKKMQRIEAMSGGEKSLTSLAFVFALQRTMPAPFYALDEVDMNLDGINVEKLANMVVGETTKGSQFLVVSLRKPMIERSARTIGVTQKAGGRTHVTGVRLRTAEEDTGNTDLLHDELMTDDTEQKKAS